MTIFDDSRASWGAAPNTNPRPVAPSSRIGISWHYDGGSPLNLGSQPHAACLARVKQDQAFHQHTRGWADIGYNALVCEHGRVIEGRGFDLQGAHSPGVNFEHYGVQFMVGGSESPTSAAYARAQRLAGDLATHSGHALRQWGHRDDPAASTECPGNLIESWVKNQTAATPNSRPIAPTAQGGLSMSDVDTILARLDALQKRADETLDLDNGATIRADLAWQNHDREVRFEALTAAVQSLAAQLANGTAPADVAGIVDKAVRDRLAQVKLSVTDAGDAAAAPAAPTA